MSDHQIDPKVKQRDIEELYRHNENLIYLMFGAFFIFGLFIGWLIWG